MTPLEEIAPLAEVPVDIEVELDRQVMTTREVLALEEYKSGHLTKPELRQLLGFETSYQLDGFLKAHDVWIDYTVEDLERERTSLKRLGF